MKKWIALLCVVALLSCMAVAFAAGSPTEPGVHKPTKTETPAQTETPAPAQTETPAPAKTETPAPAQTETPAPAQTETPAPAKTETPSNGDKNTGKKTTDTDADKTEDKLGIVVREIDLDNIKNAKLKNVVSNVNDPDVQTVVEARVSKAKGGDGSAAEGLDISDALTPAEVVEMFEDKLPEESKEKAEEVKKGDYDWASKFFEIVNEEDEESEDPIETQLSFDALIGEESDNLSDYLIMLINKDNEIYFSELDPETFDSETGTVDVTFPCQGVFALIQK